MDWPKSVAGVGLVDGKFADEDKVSGRPGSLIPAAWGNAVTDEILAVLAEGGVGAEEGNNSQLASAIKAIIAASTIAWAKVSNRPNTLQGYGITDAQPAHEILASFVSNAAWGIGRELVSDEKDLNRYVSGGKYITPSAGVQNLPAGWVQSRHVLDVSGSGNYMMQILGAAEYQRIAFRVAKAGVFSSWIELGSSIGVGQTWQDVTSSRAWATTYTNTTGRPIQISITARDPAAGNLYIGLWVGGVRVAEHFYGASMQAAATAIVPPGATYRVERADNNDTITSWMELR